MPPLTAPEIALARDALVSLRHQQNVVANFASRFLQGPAQTSALVKAGDQLREINALDFRLREEFDRLTGAPSIQHGNADLHDPANQPLSHADQAQEANTRG